MYAMTVMDDRSFRWREVPDPVAGNGELLVEIHAAALNRADLLQRAGKYPPPPGWPEWPGLEVSGVVIDAPGCRRWKPGDRVCALLGGGGYAERVVVPEAQALPVPEKVPDPVQIPARTDRPLAGDVLHTRCRRPVPHPAALRSWGKAVRQAVLGQIPATVTLASEPILQFPAGW